MTNFETLHPRITDGTFTDKPQTAPELTLAPTDPTDEAPKVRVAREFADQMRSDDKREAREATADLLAEVTSTVRSLRRARGLSEDQVEDSIGEVMIELLKRVNRGQSVQGGLVNTTARTVTSRHVNGPVRHETAKAIRILKERIDITEAERGEHLTSRQIAELADDIRMGDDFNHRHRPAENFHLIEGWVRPTSFSQFPDSYIDEQMHAFGYGAGRSFEGMDSAADQLAARLEKQGAAKAEVTKAEAMKQLWDVFSDDQDLPKATPNRLSAVDAENVEAWMRGPKRADVDIDGMDEDEAAAVLRADRLAANERIFKAIRDSEDGLETKSVVALFAPFAGITPTQRENVTSFLRRHPERAVRAVGWLARLPTEGQSRSTTVTGPTRIARSAIGPAPASRIPCEKMSGLSRSSSWTVTVPDPIVSSSRVVTARSAHWPPSP